MAGMQPPIVPGQPQYPPQPPRPTPTDVVYGTAGRAAVGTVTVIAVLVGLFCVLPMIGCGVLALLGGLNSPN